MNKWYIIKGTVGLDTDTVLLEEIDGTLYERFITNEAGNSWKVKERVKFHSGQTLERFEKFQQRNPAVTVEEITEGEAFAILL